MNYQFKNDEPADQDHLDRGRMARALAKTIEICETPLVVGLYGTWGTGKTTLMKMISKEVGKEGKNAVPIWFDAWQHQFDDDPAIALLHTMVDELKLGEEAKKLLMVIATAFGSILLRPTTIKIKDIKEIANQYEDERFQVREKQVRLRNYFSELLKKANNDGAVRLVFFIDDLDRCVPEQVLRVLEALKLFLNMPHCVYVLGVDRVALEASIKQKYQNTEVSEAEYLDKIVQLPFVIPPVAEQSMRGFMNNLLPSELHAVSQNLLAGVSANPRQAKRYVNAFTLNDMLAREMFENSHDPQLLSAILLLQLKKPDLFKELVRDVREVDKWIDDKKLDKWVHDIANFIKKGSAEDLNNYIYLSQAVSAAKLTFDLWLTGFQSDNRIDVMKLVREINGATLDIAKGLVDSLPSVVKSNLDRPTGELLKKKLEDAGCVAELR